MVVGIMVGSGIFRTPGVVAAQLGRPWLTFVAWILGGVVALAGAIAIAMVSGTGAGWSGSLPTAPTGVATLTALALAFQSVIWTYYGYPDAAKIAEEVVEPNRTLPRIYFISIALTVALYLLLNAAFLHVLPFETIASSKLVAADVAVAIFGEHGGTLVAALALLVVLASLNGNLFVTPRVVFALARDWLL